MMMALTKYQWYLLDWAGKEAKSKKNDWPGFPLTQIPLAGSRDMRELIDEGLLKIVERPSKTRPGATATYVVRVVEEEV